ncbi:hypothetical protein SLA2020_130560 [Shorea laevis]
MVCCEDRPGLTRDLTRAIGMVQEKAVCVEMMMVGGRTKNVVVMECTRAGGEEEEELRALKQALKNVVQNRAPSFFHIITFDLLNFPHSFHLIPS